MKRLFLLLLSVFTLQFASAGNDKPITFEQLPAAAQRFVKKHFAAEKEAFAKEDTELFDTSYELLFASGNKVEFDKKGEWTDIKCRQSQVPAAVVPQAILKFVNNRYPDAKILTLEKDRYSYEVKLSNRWEIKFDTKFNVIDMDQDD